MKFSPEFISDSLKSAASEEANRGEGHLLREVSTILTPEAIDSGVEIKLGKRPEELQKLIEVLQLNDGSEGFLTWSALVSREVHTVSSLGAVWVRELVKQHGVAATLQYMHAINWKAQDGNVKSLVSSAHSQLLMTGTVLGDEMRDVLDPDPLAVELSAYGNSAPVIRSEADPELSAFPEIQNMSNRDGLNAFSRYVIDKEMSVVLPHVQYAFKIGRIATSDWFTPAHIDASAGIFTYDGDRFIKAGY